MENGKIRTTLKNDNMKVLEMNLCNNIQVLMENKNNFNMKIIIRKEQVHNYMSYK